MRLLKTIGLVTLLTLTFPSAKSLAINSCGINYDIRGSTEQQSSKWYKHQHIIDAFQAIDPTWELMDTWKKNSLNELIREGRNEIFMVEEYEPLPDKVIKYLKEKHPNLVFRGLIGGVTGY